MQERTSGQPRVTDRTRTGKARSGASEWGPKLELAKPKSSDRKGRRSVESSYGTAPHLARLAQCMHIQERWPGTWVHRGTQTSSGPGSQALSQPTPSPPPPPPPTCWSWPSHCLLHQPPKPPLFRRLPQHKNHDLGWTGMTIFDSSMCVCVLRAPWPAVYSLRLQSRFLQPTLLPRRGGLSFMHCTCHELTLRQPAPNPASGTAPASLPLIMGPIAIGA